MSHPVPGHDYTEETLGEQYPGVKARKKSVAKKMVKKESLSKSLKRFGREMKRPSEMKFDARASGKSIRRQRDKQHLAF